MADKKISELDAITGADTAADDFFVVVDTSGSVTKKISRAELNNAIEQDVLAQVSITDLGSDLNTNGNDINFGDNDKAIFGAGSDLQIYHDESNSYVRDSGTGNLRLTSVNSIVLAKHNNENMLKADTDGAVTLYHNASTKLATTSTGIDVTGTVTADTLSLNSSTDFGIGTISSDSNWGMYFRSDNVGGSDPANADFNFASNANENRLRIGSGGDIIFYDSTGTTQGLFWDASTQRLGLGSTAPQKLLHLQASGGATARFQSTGARVWDIGNDATTITAFVIDDVTAGQERFRITSAGTIGIGSQSPSQKLTVEGTANNQNSEIKITASGVASGYLGSNSDGLNIGTDSHGIVFKTGVTGGGSVGATGSERLRIDTSGNVGIGTASPDSALHAFSSSINKVLTLENTGQTYQRIETQGTGSAITSRIDASTTNGNLILQADPTNIKNASSIQFEVDGSEHMRINSNGDVGIGRSDPENIVGTSGGGLVIKSGASRAGTTSLFAVQDSSGNNSFLQLHNGQTTFSTGAAGSKVETFKIANGGFITHTRASGAAQSMVGFKNGANFVGEIRTSTTATSYITSSDYRLKENVTEITSATDRLNQLNPVRFNFIADADTTVDGFLAHEVATVIPEAISGEKDEVDADGNPVMQGIDQSKLVPLLTAALQEALTKIDQLETRITALEA